jgi:hypothetical protein
MSKHEELLSDKIKLIEKKANPKNMETIYKELSSLANNEAKLKKHLKEACKLINLIGTFLVKGEGLNTTESQLIFDTFCDLDFMSLLLKYSSFNYYEINLEIITTFSFLMINIKSKTYLYYFFSKNLLNKIINKDYSNYDEEFLSYYVNFLKSLSLRLDEVSVQLFYIEKTNNFPIIENILKLYNHRDSMVRNVVRNIILNILKINCKNIQDHFTELPSISYFANIACHLRDICLQINNEIDKKKISNLQYLFDDLIDEASYIDDLLNLNLTKINYIIINCLFYYLIIPFICGAIGEKNNKISKQLALFLIIFFFVTMKNEMFKNCLFSLLFFDKINSDLEFFFGIPPEKKYYSFYPDKKKDISFCQFISENYSSKFLLTMIQPDNIIYNRYKNKFPEIEQVMAKCKGLYQKVLTSKNKVLFIDIKDYLEGVISSFFNEVESNDMSQYHLNLCMSTGLSIGQYSKENSGEIYSINFLSYMNPIFLDLKGDQKNKNDSFLSYTKNIFKEGLNKIIENLDDNSEEMILLINMLIFVIQNKDINISNNLLRHSGLENIKEKIIEKKSIMKDVMNLLGIKKSDSPLSELCFNNNDFNFINDYFLTTKDPKDKLLNTIEYPLLLSKHLLVKYKNKDKDNDKEKEKDEYLLPFTYQLIILNIINLSLNSENLFEFKKEKKDYDELMNNIDNIYKQVIETLLELIKLNKDFREDGYNKFYKKWKIYHKKFDDKNTIEFIKDEIMIKTFLLLPSEYEKSKDEEYPVELSRKQINLKDNYFGNCLLIFMMLHDLRELLLNNESSNKGNSSLKLIKDDFPLLIKSNEVSDFEMDKEYNLDKINTTKLYRKAVSYKNNKSESFDQGELVIYNKHLYFCTVIKENNVKINLKFILKSIGLFKEKGDKNFEINLLIQKSQNIEEDSALAKIFDNDDNNEGLYTIVIQFENEDAKKEAAQIITDKILSANNDERLVFDGYFKEINNSIKHLEEDF